MIAIPPTVAAKARHVGATDWLDTLPDLVNEISREWLLTVASTYPDATEAFVAAVTCSDGTPAALKLLIPRRAESADHEITVLRLADGEGCARLYRADEARGALLLERLGPSLYELKVPYQRRLEILCDVASRVWRPIDDGLLPSGTDKARWLEQHITTLWHDLGHPCSERAMRHAVECAQARAAAHDPRRARLVHGDVHQWNTLQSPTGFALVDPDGLFADPEYDLGVIMREDPEELLNEGPRTRARRLAKRTGTDETAIWQWGAVERVSTGLLCTALDMQPIGAQMLHAAEVVADVDR
jgi:streptomycin 6-kinase